MTARFLTRPGQATGIVRAPPSKSYTHRAWMLGLLATGTTRLYHALDSADPRASRRAVMALGATVADGSHTPESTDEADSTGPQSFAAITSDGVVRPAAAPIDCGNSGTTLRLATAIAALADGTTGLTGDASLCARPMRPLLDALADLGGTPAAKDGRAPLTIRGPLKGGHASLPGDISSQYVSALLLAGTRASAGLTLSIDGPLKSRPYVDITLEMLRAFGGHIDETAEAAPTYHVAADQNLRATDYEVPGDYSTAAFPLAAGALAGDVTVEGLPARSVQGDRAFIAHLRAFGADVHMTPTSVRARASRLEGDISLDLAHTPDAFPMLAALAATARGTTRLTGAAHLRLKESDRIAVMVANLRKLGVQAREEDDGATITGGPIGHAADLTTHGDHRILMALAVLGLVADGPLALDEPTCYQVSYPGFLDDMTRLGAPFEVAR